MRVGGPRYTPDASNNKHGFLPMESIENTLAANHGRMPVVNVGGEAIGQSPAINYFIAAELDMLGDTTVETAQILAIQETLKEMKNEIRKHVECVASFLLSSRSRRSGRHLGEQ